MAMKNKIKNLVDSNGETVYAFWKRTGLSRTTAYDLYNNPDQFPKGNVFDVICKVYGVSPNDIVEYVAEV